MKAYYDARAPEYDEVWLGTGRYAARKRPGWNEEVERLSSLVRALPSARTLDVACGTGFLTRFLPGEVTGLDQSEAMLAIARKRLPAGALVRGDASRLPFPDGAFERVFTSFFYGHLGPYERSRFLGEARRVAGELVVVDSGPREGREPESIEERLLADGSRWEVLKRRFTGAGLSRRARRRRGAARGALLRGRARVTRRRSRYRSLASLQLDNAGCRACAEAGFPLESLPVVSGHASQRIYLFGQAPGVVEGRERRPWRGRAGTTLRAWLAMDEDEFYATFYCAAVTRCYPGRSPSGRGDRTPSRHEQRLCTFWRDWELRLLHPGLIVTVGGLALAQLLGEASLTRAVGRSFELDGTTLIALPHPSGASGWLNDPENRRRLERALALVRTGLGALPRG